MKRSLSILLVLSLLLTILLVGCPNPQQGVSPTASPTGVVNPTTPPDKVVTLTLWTHKGAFEKGFKATGEAFTQKTGGRVKLDVKVYEGDDPYKQKLAAASSTKALPDIYVTWAGVGESFVGEFNNNAVLEFTNLVDPAWKKNFLPSSWKEVTVKENDIKNYKKDTTATQAIKNLKAGQLFGVPLDVGYFFTFYGNKKAIEQTGLKAEAPKTWEDFIEMLKTIKARTGVSGLVYGAKSSDIWWNWAGGALETMANGEEGYRALLTRKEHLSDQKHLRVIEAQEALVKSGVLAEGLLDTNIEQANNAFVNEEAAFVLGGSFTMSDLVNLGMKADDIIMFSIPPIKGSKYTEWKITPTALLQMRVPVYTKHQKEAIEFIKFITSPEGALVYDNNSYDISSIDLSSVADKLDPILKTMTKDFPPDGGYLAKVDEYPVNYRSNNEWRILDLDTQKLTLGRATPKDMAKRFDDQMDAELAREKAAGFTQ